MRIHNLYVDARGETHFRDIEVEWVEERPGGKLSVNGKIRHSIFVPID
ncbi:MAG TPA: hypothetical protein VLX44_06375 [Xanthobacteraceae bacterium]|nr:hypothetical protein [Xanthobacteraceae bacterium]